MPDTGYCEYWLAEVNQYGSPNQLVDGPHSEPDGGGMLMAIYHYRTSSFADKTKKYVVVKVEVLDDPKCSYT